MRVGRNINGIGMAIYRNRKLNVTGVEQVGTFVTKTPYETFS